MLRAMWRRYKEEVRHLRGPFPFGSRRMTLFDKLHSDFVSAVAVVGMIWLVVRLARYVFG